MKIRHISWDQDNDRGDVLWVSFGEVRHREIDFTWRIEEVPSEIKEVVENLKMAVEKEVKKELRKSLAKAREREP